MSSTCWSVICSLTPRSASTSASVIVSGVAARRSAHASREKDTKRGAPSCSAGRVDTRRETITVHGCVVRGRGLLIPGTLHANVDVLAHEARRHFNGLAADAAVLDVGLRSPGRLIDLKRHGL